MNERGGVGRRGGRRSGSVPPRTPAARRSDHRARPGSLAVQERAPGDPDGGSAPAAAGLHGPPGAGPALRRSRRGRGDVPRLGGQDRLGGRGGAERVLLQPPVCLRARPLRQALRPGSSRGDTPRPGRHGTRDDRALRGGDPEAPRGRAGRAPGGGPRGDVALPSLRGIGGRRHRGLRLPERPGAVRARPLRGAAGRGQGRGGRRRPRVRRPRAPEPPPVRGAPPRMVRGDGPAGRPRARGPSLDLPPGRRGPPPDPPRPAPQPGRAWGSTSGSRTTRWRGRRG